MRALHISMVVLAIVAACGHASAPPPPTVTGTLVCDPRVQMLGANAEPPDELGAIEALEREVVTGVTGDAFLRRVAADEHVDAAAIAGAVSARPVKDSRLVEVGVALPDRALATRVCDAILDHYVADRMHADDPLATPPDDVRVVDHCAPPRPAR